MYRAQAFSHVSGTPAAGTATVTPTSGTAATAFSLSLTGESVGGGITYQWKSSPYPTFGFTNISGASTAAYNFTGITADTYYECVVLPARQRFICHISIIGATYTGAPWARMHGYTYSRHNSTGRSSSLLGF